MCECIDNCCCNARFFQCAYCSDITFTKCHGIYLVVRTVCTMAVITMDFISFVTGIAIASSLPFFIPYIVTLGVLTTATVLFRTFYLKYHIRDEAFDHHPFDARMPCERQANIASSIVEMSTAILAFTFAILTYIYPGYPIILFLNKILDFGLAVFAQLIPLLHGCIDCCGLHERASADNFSTNSDVHIE